jgi:hypothetical protein
MVEYPKPGLWQGYSKLPFEEILCAQQEPEGLSLAIRSQLNGVRTVGNTDWRSADTPRIGFGDSGSR